MHYVKLICHICKIELKKYYFLLLFFRKFIILQSIRFASYKEIEQSKVLFLTKKQLKKGFFLNSA